MKGEPKVPLKTKADLNNLVKTTNPPTTFKSGGSLPTLDAGKENKSKTVVKFQEEFEDEDDGFGSDFDANELMDLKDYKNKKPSPAKAAPASTKPAPAKNAPNAKSTVTAAADEAWDLEDDDENNGWGEDDYSDLKKFDYKNTDLNKMTDYQLQRHKQNMEQDFKKNVLKPGDKGFEYDKRVDYSS